MAVSDSALNSALEKIFQRLVDQEKRSAVSVPPLGGGAAAVPEAPRLTLREALREARAKEGAVTAPLTSKNGEGKNKKGSTGALSSIPGSQQQLSISPPPPHGAGNVSSPARKKLLPPIASPSPMSIVSTTGAASSKISPARSSSLPGGRHPNHSVQCDHDPNPLHTHTRFCAECARDSANAAHRQLEKFMKRESDMRERIVRECFSEYELGITGAWLAVRDHRELIRHRHEWRAANEERARRVESDIANQLMKELRILRRDVSTEWEVGFDEIGALQRISLRHYIQIRDVKERSLAKRTAEEEAERTSYEQQQQRQLLQRQLREITQLENEEKRGRRHLVECEEGVNAAIFAVFKDHRKKLLDTEGHIMALVLRHQQKLQQYENEKEKMKQEEVARREGNVNTEKRAFESMLLLEPELRKRAVQLMAARLKKDAANRQAMLDRAIDGCVVVEAEEKVDREGLYEQQKLDLVRAEHRRERRQLNDRRRIWRMGIEAAAAEEMLLEDHAAWRLVRHSFERTMVFAAVEEEAIARADLAVRKHEEKLFIWSLLRARQVVFQNEHHQRLELIDERLKFLADFEESLRISQDQSMFVWLETIRRRTIEEEWRDTQSEFVLYQPVIVAAASATAKFSRTKTDRPVQSTTSDMSMYLHSNMVQWLFLSDGCTLLEFSSIRNGTTTLTELKNCPVAVEIVNPMDGDILYFDDDGHGNLSDDSNVLTSSTMMRAHLLRTTYSGHVSGLFSGVKYKNCMAWSKFRMCPRVIKIKIEGMSFVMYVLPQIPLCAAPDVLLCTRVAAPFANFLIPSSSEFKSFRCQLSLTDDAMSAGHKLSFVLPSEYFDHPRNGVTLNGKQQMKVLQNSPQVVEFEMDPKTPNLKTLLNAIKLVHGDDVNPCEALDLQAWLLRRSDAVVVRVQQKIDIDRCDVDSPRLRASSLDIPLHASSASTSEKNFGYVPVINQHVFHNCFILFPEMVPDVMGGTLHFELGNHDKTAAMAFEPSSDFDFCIHPRDMTRIIDRASAELLAKDRDARVDQLEDFGTILGQGSPSMIIKLHQEKAYRTDFINDLLRSVAINSNRKSNSASSSSASNPASPTGGAKAKSVVVMQLTVRIDVSVHDDPIVVTFNLSSGPAVIESTAKTGAFPYKEGSGAKAFPTIQLKQWPLVGTKIGPEAVLHVKILDGVEDADVIELLDTQQRTVNGNEKCVYVQAGQVIATVERVSSSELLIYVSGELPEKAPWMRKAITDPYQFSFVSQDKLQDFDVTSQQVNVLLRSLRYMCNSVDPQEEEKRIMVMLDNGRTGRSCVILHLTVETVDDPTDIVFSKTQLEYRQMSRSVSGGFGIMPDVRLEDVDSDNFHGGYIIVDHVSPGPNEIGDSLTILTQAQQETIIHGGKGGSVSFTTYLETLLGHAEQPWKLAALATVSDEAPQRLLSLRDGKLLMYCGEQIGSISMKYSGRDKDLVVVKQIRFNFYSESRFVSFPAAEYCMRCVGFENLNPKMVAGPRIYQITLNCTGLASTADTVERLTIVGFNAILSYPPSAPNVQYDEGGRPRPILKLVNASVTTNIFQKGFFQATILNPCEGDELQLEPANDVKIRDNKLIMVGKETFGNMPPRKLASSLRVDFLKVSAIALITFAKCLAFSSTNTKSMDPTQRVIEIQCTPNSELEMCTFNILVDVVKKEMAAEVSFAERVVPYMTGSSPVAFLKGITITAQDTYFPSGTTTEVSLSDKAKSGESIVVQSSANCRFVIREGASPPHILVLLNDAEAAIIPMTPREIDDEGSGLFVFTNVVYIQCLAELEGWELAMILENICYMNSRKADTCAKKTIMITIRQRSLVLVRATCSVEIAPPPADFSTCPLVLQGADTKGGLVVPSVRMELVPSARDVVITVNLLSGFDYTDVVKLCPIEADIHGLSVDGDMIFFTSEERFAADGAASVNASSSSPSEKMSRSKSVIKTSKQCLGTMTSSVTSISLRVETPSNSAIQAFLRSIIVQGEPCSHKSILAEVLVACSYGHCRQVLRMMM